MADKPTVNVVKDSVDEKALRSQYGDSIGYTYGENQFVGSDRTATNQAYQRYLSTAGVNPINNNVDLNSLTGAPVANGKLATGYDEASAMGNIQNNLQSSAGDYLTSQQAGLKQMLDNSIATLSKAYEDAIADGSISVRQAQADFAERKKVLEQQAYVQTQATRVYGNNQGLSNSQQMVGLMAGDNARANANVQGAMSDRDKRIGDITDRMNAISKQKNLDLSAAQKEYDSGALKASAEARKMVSDGLLGLQSDSLNAGRTQAFNEKNMATQQGYDLDKMDKQFDQSLQLENIQYAHQAALQSARTQSEVNAANNKAAQELDMAFKAYGINPSDPDALQQLRLAQNKEVIQGKASSEAVSAAVAGKTSSLFNNPALQNGQDEAPTWNALNIPDWMRKITPTWNLIDSIRNPGYQEKSAAYEANNSAQKAIDKYLSNLGISL